MLGGILKRYAIPAIGAIGAAGMALHYAPPVYNELDKAFDGNGEWIDLKLKDLWNISSNTKHYVFELPKEDQVSGLVTASCLLAKYVTPKGSNVVRPYTPVSDVEQKGTLDFVVKTYENGKFSQHLYNLKPNDVVAFKGPIVKWKWEPNQFKHISLIGGGSGITPLFQLLHHITKNPEDKTKVDLYFGNTLADDILMRKELDEIANKYKDQVTVYFFVDKAPADWKHQTGHINKDFLKEHLPPPSKDLKIFVCGPPGLYKALSGPKISPTEQGEVTGVLGELGYNNDHVYKF